MQANAAGPGGNITAVVGIDNTGVGVGDHGSGPATAILVIKPSLI